MSDETRVPPMPDPEKLPSASGLSNKTKRYLFFGILGVGALIVLGNLLTSPAPKPSPRAADTTARQQQQQNPTREQLAEWQNNLAAAEAQLKAAEAQRQQAKQSLADANRDVTPDDLHAAHGGQDPRDGPSSEQANEAEQQRQQLKAEREALAYKSLFSDSMIRQDQPEKATKPEAERDLQEGGQPPVAVPVEHTAQTAAAATGSAQGNDAADKRKPLDFAPTKQPTFWLPEGTVIEGVLTNKLDGDQVGPVNVLVSSAVYLPGTRLLLIPQGARVLGEASKVESFGQARLAVAFHRILVPGLANYSIPLDKTPAALAQAGEVGLSGKVNSHYASIFGASLAVGAIGGLAQIGNGAGSFSTMSEFRNGVSESTAQSSAKILDRFLNRLPTITIPEGTRVRVLLTDDLQLPSYASMHVDSAGGGL